MADPLSRALELAGFRAVGWFVALGAAISMSAVLLVFQSGQPRTFFAMARDGLSRSAGDRFGIWLVLYFCYGFKHSGLRGKEYRGRPLPDTRAGVFFLSAFICVYLRPESCFCFLTGQRKTEFAAD